MKTYLLDTFTFATFHSISLSISLKGFCLAFSCSPILAARQAQPPPSYPPQAPPSAMRTAFPPPTPSYPPQAPSSALRASYPDQANYPPQPSPAPQFPPMPARTPPQKQSSSGRMNGNGGVGNNSMHPPASRVAGRAEYEAEVDTNIDHLDRPWFYGSLTREV